jgi:hypothetical protein
MDAPATTDCHDSREQEAETLELKRLRLLASLTLIGGFGLVLALPFALRAGAEFFLPVTAALVIAIALVPMLEWFERRGVPRSWPRAVRHHLPDDRGVRFGLDRASGDRLGGAHPVADRRVTKALAPCSTSIRTLRNSSTGRCQHRGRAARQRRTVRVETPNSMLD